MDPELTLAKTMKLVRQKEAVQQHNTQLQNSSDTKSPIDLSPIDKKHSSIKGAHSVHHKGDGRGTWLPGKSTPKPCTQPCTRCVRGSHPIGTQCPASGATCKRCMRKVHYASQCFSKTVKLPTNEVSVDRSTLDDDELTLDEGLSLDSAFLDAVTLGSHKPIWNATLLMNTFNAKVVFKLDTRAEATAITEKTYNSLPNVVLKKPKKTLQGPTKQHLNVLGQFTTTLSHGPKFTIQTIYVINGHKTNLLGLPAITALNILCRVDALMCDAHSVHAKFPTLFKGLGTLGDKYIIKLKEDAIPYSLCTPRNVAIPLREKVKQELTRMENNGVILRVTEPTAWCAGMVVVPKCDGSARICVDFKMLNESILREVHPIPKVDNTLAQLSGAIAFSKLDANSGFWQIPLAETSRPLTTFITPYGHYLTNKLPFGISCAPELFQLRMNKIIEGLKGVV